ncbi:MAG: DUF2723 domain-containing protein, partial [Anaerolineales bacterium]|nr:DUF2723 domain-containing protein [Anaerolineales bacterium]
MQRVGHGLKWLPGLAVGLFVSRLAAESLAPASWWQVLLLTAVFTLPLAWLLARLPLAHTWPALLLTPYLLYPEPDPRIAALMAAAAGITALLLSRPAARPCQRPYLVAAGIALAFFLLYWQTLAPGLLPADSGEFQVVAANLGVAHPPGFPLYTLLGHLMTRLPLSGTAAYQVNLLSAITSSLTLAFVYLTAHHLTQRTLPGLTAVLALGTATTFWSQATGANVRSLTGLFAALMLYALVRWQAARRAAPQSDRWLVLFALALGFGLTHHVSLLFMACIFGLFIFWNDPTLLRQPHRWLRPFLAAAAGLLPLLYLPLRAAADVRGASPALATLNGFLDHVLARGFSGDFFYFIAPADLWARLRVMGNVMTFQFHPWLLAGMAAGLVVLLRRDRRLTFLLGGAWLLHTLITATYRAPQTVEYMLPAYVPAALLLAYAVAAGQQALHGRFRAVAAPLLAITLLAAARQGVRHYDSFAWLSRSMDTRDDAQTLLDQAPANTLLLADWHWATPLWYLQEVENRRPDVTVRFVFPEAAPYAETWATRIAAALAAGETVLATHYDADAYAALPPAEPLGDAFLYRQSPLRQLPPAFTALDVTLGDTLRLTGYHLATAALPAGQEARLTLAWQATTAPPANLTLFAHLVGPDGRLYAQQDVRVIPQPAGLTLTQFRLPPRPGALPGAYQILVGAYAAAPL